MEYQNLVFDVEDGVATITFNRPKALNAMNSVTMKELYDAAMRCQTDAAIKAFILTGAGDKAFVAGADISEMQEMRPQQAMEFMELGHATLRLIETMGKPSIAAVNGFALGGGTEISMACDMRFASDKARFGQPEILIGLIPGWGGTQRLGRIVGDPQARRMIFSGAPIGAEEALRVRLVDEVVPTADDLNGALQRWFKAMEPGSPHAIARAKRALLQRDEIQEFSKCFSCSDAKEGITAFLEKRKPVFNRRRGRS
jgi:enoyl-CoA hydratase